MAALLPKIWVGFFFFLVFFAFFDHFSLAETQLPSGPCKLHHLLRGSAHQEGEVARPCPRPLCGGAETWIPSVRQPGAGFPVPMRCLMAGSRSAPQPSSVKKKRLDPALVSTAYVEVTGTEPVGR